MESPPNYLIGHWFAFFLIAVALVLGVMVVVRWFGTQNWSAWLIVPGVSIGLIGLGGLLSPTIGPAFGWFGWAWLLVCVALGILSIKLIVVILTCRWSAPVAAVMGGCLLLAVGSLCAEPIGRGLAAALDTLLHLTFAPLWLEWCPKWLPLWLWILFWGLMHILIEAAFVVLGLISLSGLPVFRRIAVIGLACTACLALMFALDRAAIRHQSETVTVIFLVDRSFSIPDEPPYKITDKTLAAVRDEVVQTKLGVLKEKGFESRERLAQALATILDEKELSKNRDVVLNNAKIKRRWDRVQEFINTAVEKRGPGHQRDQAGVILFGRRPRLESPPAAVQRFNFDFDKTTSEVDGNYTDIAAAMKLALASFPEGTAKRIIIISDGNENLGNAEEQARLARLNGVEIDVLPLAAGQQNENEVLVQSIEAPTTVELGSQVPIRIFVRSFNPNVVVGRLSLTSITEDDKLGQARQAVEIDPNQRGILDPGTPEKAPRVALERGLNSFAFRQKLSRQQRSYTYEAEFVPEWVQEPGPAGADEKPRVLTQGLPGDRVQNNRASTHVVARGHGRVLVVEQKPGDQKALIDTLRKAGNDRWQVSARSADNLPPDKDHLGFFLSNYDSVILANVPADSFSEGQMEVIASNTREQGCGLIMVGGPDSFGAGGWQKTPVEKALPVDCDIRSLEVEGKGGLVLIMHASEMSEGNLWQKRVAKLAIEKLSPIDMVGVIYYGFGGGHVWHIPFQQVGEKGNRNKLLGLVDSMSPGDMPDVDPALSLAHAALTNAAHGLAKKHIIFISDGDHWNAGQGEIGKLRAARITCTTVCITSHGAGEIAKMKKLADDTRGRAYAPTSGKQLPAIYTKETRFVSQSFIHEQPNGFNPDVRIHTGPTEKLDRVPPLLGYVRTTPKQAPTVQNAIMTPRDAKNQDFPILSYWQYGLGKAVAFTSDASQLPPPADAPNPPLFWASRWYASAMYSRFWEQTVEWSLRPMESNRLAMTTEFRDGKVRVVVEARDKGRPITDFEMNGAVTMPGVKGDNTRGMNLKKLVQQNSGVYVTEFKAEETGSYFVNVRAERLIDKLDKDGKPVMKDGKREQVPDLDSVRSGVTIPYSPEFSDFETNVPLLEKLRTKSGATYEDDESALKQAAESGNVFRKPGEQTKSLQPIWYWLILLTAGLLFVQIAMRRIAINPEKTAAWAGGLWDQLRGRVTTTAKVPEYFERLRSRKSEVSEEIRRERARRFEGDDAITESPVNLADPLKPEARPSRQQGPKPEFAPEKEQEAADFTSRLMKAKKRVWTDREKDEDQ